MVATLAKAEAKTTGYFLFLAGLLSELFVLLSSILSGPFIDKPWLFALTQVIPIIFIEAGLKRIKQSSSMQVDEIEQRYEIDKASLTTIRTLTIFQNVKVIIILIILLIAFAIFSFFMISKQGLEFGLHSWFTLGLLILYILILRKLIIFLFKKIKGKTRGVGLKYQFENNYLLLQIPINPFQKKSARIPLSKIEDCKTLNNTEAITLGQSFERQYSVGLFEMKDLINFAKDEIPYPRYYEYNVNPMNVVYIKGEDFDYLISVENPEYFVNEIRKRKNG